MTSPAPLPPGLLDRLWAAQDEDGTVDLLRRAVRAPSVTGSEATMVAMLRPEMERSRLAPVVEEFRPGRPNVYGSREGRPEAPRLLLMGHTDVVHPLDWSRRWAGAPQEDPFGAAMVAGELWGVVRQTSRRGSAPRWPRSTSSIAPGFDSRGRFLAPLSATRKAASAGRG